MSFRAVYDLSHGAQEGMAAIVNVGSEAKAQARLITAEGETADAKTIGAMIALAAQVADDPSPLLVTASNDHTMSGIALASDSATRLPKLDVLWQHSVEPPFCKRQTTMPLHPEHLVKAVVAQHAVAVVWFRHMSPPANSLFCLSSSDGQQQWTLTWPKAESVCDMVALDALLVCQNSEGVVAMALRDGKLRWSSRFPGLPRGVDASNELLVVATSEGVWGVTPSGAIAWHWPCAVARVEPSWRSVAMVEGYVVAYLDTGEIACLSDIGKLLWQRSLRPLRPWLRPLLVNGTLVSVLRKTETQQEARVFDLGDGHLRCERVLDDLPPWSVFGVARLGNCAVLPVGSSLVEVPLSGP